MDSKHVDSDCDWFEKDIDEILSELENKIASTNSNSENDVEYISGEENDEFTTTAISSKGLTGILGEFPTSKLQAITKMPPLEALICVMTCDAFFSIQLKANDEKKVQLFFQVLATICRMEVPGFFEEAISKFIENVQWHTALHLFTKNLFSKQNENSKNQIEIDDFFSSLEFIFTATLKLSSNHKVVQLFEQIKNCILKDNISLCKSASITGFTNNVEYILNKKMEETAEQVLEILPTLDEVKNQQLNAAITVEYEHSSAISKYLNAQKNFLKQEFVTPLLEDITKILTNQESSIFLFKDVSICHKEDLIDVDPTQKIFIDLLGKQRSSCNKKTNGKSFKSGTLLCLTTSLKFDNLILAIVGHTNSEMERDSYLNIEIVKNYLVTNIYEEDFIMFESPVFFEPYSNAFNALNTFDETSFPMSKYIVMCEKRNQHPEYLTNEINYTFKGETYKPFTKSTNNYPNALRKRLNTTQLNAFNNALNNEFCLIQGPPGTGKTHLSVNIVATLVENYNHPIVLITYTNDSLDKFLVELSKETENIVRFGNQSKVSILNRFNIKETANIKHPCLEKLYKKTKKLYEMKFSQLRQHYDYERVQKELRDLSTKLQSIKIIRYYYKVRDKGVIAMTSTCAAKLNLLFRLLKTSIVIFEEAAEIMEPHIVACLTRFTQHVILVGDHKQLQPHTSHPLSQMNVSLFERLIKSGISFIALNEQYRMRKEIADLIRPVIYEDLIDAGIVETYKSVRGMKKNVFFLSHTHEESDSPEETSKYNQFEVDYVCQLANYLIEKQNYGESDVVILSPYTNQTKKISSKINQIMSYGAIGCLKVATIDSFQGMESNIVILSLVRNNRSNQIGFLAKTNRICVSLSRARLGLYIIGNIDLLAQNSIVWRKIQNTLENQNAIGDLFPLSS